MKPWVIQGVLTFNFVDRTLTILRKAVEQYFPVVLFVILEN